MQYLTILRVTTQLLEVGDELTEKELDVITTVFRSYETGLREATILPKVPIIITSLV